MKRYICVLIVLCLGAIVCADYIFDGPLRDGGSVFRIDVNDVTNKDFRIDANDGGSHIWVLWDVSVNLWQSSSGSWNFDDDNLTTTGIISGVNVTSATDPGHVHTSAGIVDDSLFPVDINDVDSPGDEEILTYEAIGSDFSGDANCKALWDFETAGTILTDSKGTNTLTKNGTPYARTAQKQQGNYSLMADADDYLEIADTSLDAGFPLKSGDTNKKISVCFWVRISTLSSYGLLVNKHFGSNKVSFGVRIQDLAGTKTFRVVIGYNGGASEEHLDHGTGVAINTWYHVGATFDNSDKSYKIRIWDDTAGQLLGGAEVTGTSTNNINVEDAPVRLGWTPWSINGYLDEVAFFDDILSSAEIDAVRGGSHDFASDGNCKALWNLENTIGNDTKSTAHIGGSTTGIPTHDAVNQKVGTGALDFENATPDYIAALNAELPAGFPLKSGDTNKKISLAFWVKFESFPAVGTTDGIYCMPNLYKYSISVDVVNDGGTNKLMLRIGYSGGDYWEDKAHASGLSTGIWYHVGVTFQDSDKSYRIRIWDDNGSTILGSDLTGNTTNNINIEDSILYIGRGYTTANCVDGLIDEMVVFDDILTQNEIDEIRQGTYGGGGAGFEWHTIVEMLALTDTDSLAEGSTNLYQDSELTNWIDDVTLGSSGALTIPSGQSFTLSGFTQGSVPFIGAGGLFSQDNSNLFFDDTNDRMGIGINTGLGPNPGMTISGDFDILHTADVNDDHAFEIDLDAAGHGDVKAIDIDYITGAIAKGDDEGVILINIDEIAANGGDVFGLEVLATEGNAGIYGMKVGALIGPIHQDSGDFVNPDVGTDNSSDVNAPNMIDGTSGTTTAIFDNNSEYILIGAATAFQEIEFIITTGSSGAGIKPTFGYSIAGSHSFTTFSPVDGTNGFRNTGVVAWDASDLSSHGINTDTNTYDIRITRTRNSLSTSPVLGYAKTAATTEYIWDKDGDVNIRDLTLATGRAFTVGTNRIDNGSDLLDGEMIGNTTIDDDSIDWSDCTLADFDYETNWKMWYSDGSGDVTELSLGANGTFLESNGASAVPAFRTLLAADIPDISATSGAIGATLVSLAGLTETNGGIPYGTANNAYAWLGAGAEGALLMGNGAGAPSWLAAGATTTILVGGGAADPVWTTATGSGAPVRGTSPTFTTSVVMADGATLGQAAGPLVTFDDSGDDLEISGCNVGIGTAGPSNLLHLQAASPELSIESTATSTGSSSNLIFGHSQSGTTPTGKIYSYLTGGSEAGRAGHLIFQTATGGSLQDRMTIEDSGEVGIGTTSPGALFHISSSAHGASKVRIESTISSVAGIELLSGHGNWGVYNSDTIADALEFRDDSAGSTRMIIDSSGDVGFGETNPQEDVHAADTIRADTAFNLNGTDGVSGTLVLDDGTTERITLVFSGGILTSRTVAAASALLIDWTD